MNKDLIEFGTHVFCFDCGSSWSEYGDPPYCINCGSVGGLASRKISLIEKSFMGIMWEESNGRHLAQLIHEEEYCGVEYCVPVPANMISLDLAVFDATSGTVRIRTSIDGYIVVPITEYVIEGLSWLL